MLENINIRKFRDEDKSQVINLLNRNFKMQEHLKVKRDLEWWNWKYDQNVFGESIIYVAEINRTIIGVRPFWPWKLKNDGREISCYQPIDAVVDKEYRGIGIFSELTTKALQDNSIKSSLIFNFPNEQSIGSNIKLGWRFVGKLHWYIKIKKIISFSKMAANLNDFEPCLLKEEDKINSEKINRIGFSNYASKLSTVKTVEFFTWRYLNHPKISYGLNIIEKNNKQIFFIYEINKNDIGEELIVLDYDGDMELISEMLQAIDDLAEKYDVTYILVIKKWPIQFKFLLQNKFILQKKKNLVTLPLNEAYRTIATSYDNWEICVGMHDSI
jgi:hypothetical protein